MTMRDLIAERQVLAIALSGPAEIQAQFAAMPPGAFGDHDPNGGAGPHDVVATVLRDRIRRRIPIDPAILAADAAAVAGTDDKARRIGLFVAELASAFPPAASWTYYAERVLLLHAAREASVHAYRLAQRLETADEPADVVELVRGAATELNATMDGLIGSASEPPLSLADMLDAPEEPYDWLVPNLWERGDRVMITGFEGTGKALALDTPIATPKGWTTMGELSVGAEVFGPDGKVARVVAATEVMHGRPCYRMTFSDGARIVADANHLWLTETLASREATSRLARRGPLKPHGSDQRRKRVHVPEIVTTQQIAETVQVRNGHALNHSIETTAPLEYPAQELPINAYVLGAWLGDGTSISATITSADPEIIQEIMTAGVPCTKTPSAKYLWRMTDGVRHGRGPGSALTMNAKLRALGMFGNKHIPEIYQRSSVEQRLALLCGLMDTDGTVDRKGTCEFSVCNERLARDVHELLIGLGIKVTARASDAVLDGRVVGIRYRLWFQTELPVFRLPRKAERLQPLRTRRAKLRYITAVEPVESVPVRCIQVDRADGLFVAGRECITTHNSYLLAQFALAIAAGVHPFRAEVIKPYGHRVLIFDMENSRRQNRRRYARIRRQVDRIRETACLTPVDWSTAVRFYHRPEGIDLSNPSEVARAERAIAATAPDLVLAGPLYRMHRLNLNDEMAARELVEVLDRWRVKYGFTLIVEAHAGHVGETSGGRKLRPTGSSLFLRWPEFGFGIRAFGPGLDEEHPSTVEMVAWRGSRDERDWPKILTHGESLPWVPSDPEYERRHLSVVS